MEVSVALEIIVGIKDFLAPPSEKLTIRLALDYLDIHNCSLLKVDVVIYTDSLL